MNKQPCYITIGDTPFCDWLACPSGLDIAAKSGVYTCAHRSLIDGKRAAKALAPFFKAGVVRTFRGRCASV